MKNILFFCITLLYLCCERLCLTKLLNNSLAYNYFIFCSIDFVPVLQIIICK